MGLMDKLKKTAEDAQQVAASAVSDKLAEREQAQLEKAETKREIAELKDTFNPTKTIGDISVDSVHRLFKVKHATADVKKKSGALAKTGKAFVAVSTLGASVAVEHAMKPSDCIFRFDEIRSFELLEDDSQIAGGGVGAAVAGGVLFGGAGAIAGSVVGKKKTTKTVDNLVLKINLRDFDLPCVMIPYITKKTSVTSGDYRKALSAAQQTVSCLELIIEEVNRNKE